jgi:arylsulfatase A-like enzyme
VRGEEEQPNPRQAFSITGFANRFMEARVKAAQPFFLQISYRAIHIGVRARPATTEKYLNAPSGRRHRNALYAALTEDLDTDLGLLLDKIDDLGIADSTYVVYTSDNGADAGPLSSHITSNAPLSGFKTTLLEGGIRVPFVVRGPGIAGGIVSHVPVIGYDLFPTIRDWLGLEEPLSRGVEGGSLKRLAENRGRGQIERPRDELVWHYPYYRTGCLPPQSAIRLGDLKLIHNWESDQVQLFDLSRDLGETQDLASTMRDQAIALGQRLRDYLTAVGAPMPQTNPDYDPHRDPTRECQRTDSQSRSAARAWSNPA